MITPRRLQALRSVSSRAAQSRCGRTGAPRAISINTAGKTNEYDNARVIGMPPPDDATSSSLSSSSSQSPEYDSIYSSSDPIYQWSSASASDQSSSNGWAADAASSDSTLDESNPAGLAVAPVPLPTPALATRRRVRHPFDSHAFVSHLERASLPLQTAKNFMEGAREVLVDRTERVTGNMLSREELDNEAYLFKAAMSKLRTEFNVRNRNTGQVARDTVGALRRELERVEHKMAGDMQVLKHDVELDLNNRKDENRNDKKNRDIMIEEINSRATISVGDLRTEIESAKWEATRRAIATIVTFVILGVGISTIGWPWDWGQTGPHGHKPPPVPQPTPSVHPLPTIETRDVGVGTDEDLFKDEYAARIDKLLSSVQPEPKPKPKRRPSKSEVFIDRI